MRRDELTSMEAERIARLSTRRLFRSAALYDGLPFDSDGKPSPHDEVAIDLARGADPTFHEPIFGLSALHIAAFHGKAIGCKKLLDAGANPGSLTREGKTALIYAVEKGHRDVVEILLNVAVVAAPQRRLAMDAALNSGHYEICEPLMCIRDQGPRMRLLRHAQSLSTEMSRTQELLREEQRRTEALRDEMQKQRNLSCTNALHALPSVRLAAFHANLSNTLGIADLPNTIGIQLTKDDPMFLFIESRVLGSLHRHRPRATPAQPKPTFCPKPELEIIKIATITCPLERETIFRAQRAMVLSTQKQGCSEIPGLDAVRIPKKQCAKTKTINECFLFHGLKESSLQAVINHGFRPRNGDGLNGQLFGHGTYFADRASKADRYSTVYSTSTARPEQVMLYVRVILGETHVVDSTNYHAATAQHWFQPPYRKQKLFGHGQPADSVTVPFNAQWHAAGGLDHPEYVVYEPAQCLPEFIIYYRHRPTCQCAQCVSKQG